jgi:hypothetical protein
MVILSLQKFPDYLALELVIIYYRVHLKVLVKIPELWTYSRKGRVRFSESQRCRSLLPQAGEGLGMRVYELMQA